MNYKGMRLCCNFVSRRTWTSKLISDGHIWNTWNLKENKYVLIKRNTNIDETRFQAWHISSWGDWKSYVTVLFNGFSSKLANKQVSDSDKHCDTSTASCYWKGKMPKQSLMEGLLVDYSANNFIFTCIKFFHRFASWLNTHRLLFSFSKIGVLLLKDWATWKSSHLCQGDTPF